MINFLENFIKWVIIIFVGTTAVAIIVTGAISVFNYTVLKMVDKIAEQKKSYYLLYEYFKVRKPFHKWVKFKKDKGEDIMKPPLSDLM